MVSNRRGSTQLLRTSIFDKAIVQVLLLGLVYLSIGKAMRIEEADGRKYL